MTEDEPTALELADQIDAEAERNPWPGQVAAANLLRRQHAVIEALTVGACPIPRRAAVTADSENAVALTVEHRSSLGRDRWVIVRDVETWTLTQSWREGVFPELTVSEGMSGGWWRRDTLAEVVACAPPEIAAAFQGAIPGLATRKATTT